MAASVAPGVENRARIGVGQEQEYIAQRARRQKLQQNIAGRVVLRGDGFANRAADGKRKQRRKVLVIPFALRAPRRQIAHELRHVGRAAGKVDHRIVFFAATYGFPDGCGQVLAPLPGGLRGASGLRGQRESQIKPANQPHGRVGIGRGLCQARRARLGQFGGNHFVQPAADLRRRCERGGTVGHLPACDVKRVRGSGQSGPVYWCDTRMGINPIFPLASAPSAFPITVPAFTSVFARTLAAQPFDDPVVSRSPGFTADSVASTLQNA